MPTALGGPFFGIIVSGSQRCNHSCSCSSSPLCCRPCSWPWRRRSLMLHALRPTTPSSASSSSMTDDDGDTFSAARRTHRRGVAADTVGVLAGSSAAAAAEFVKKVEGLPVVLCSDPCPPPPPPPQLQLQLQSSDAVAALRGHRRFLENAGAACIVMPCHEWHAHFDDLARDCGVPFLHMPDCTARRLQQLQLRALEPTATSVKIGLLASSPNLAAGFYQRSLRNQGFEVVIPDKETMEHIVVPAMEALKRQDIEGGRILVRIALQILLVRAVSMVVVASYDLMSLLTPDDPLVNKCLDPLDALAIATVQWSHDSSVLPPKQ